MPGNKSGIMLKDIMLKNALYRYERVFGGFI